VASRGEPVSCLRVRPSLRRPIPAGLTDERRARQEDPGATGPEQYLRNNASLSGLAAGNGPFTILDVPGEGKLEAFCANPAQPTVRWLNDTGQDERLAVDSGGANGTYTDPVADGTTAGAVTGSTALDASDHVVYMVRGPGGAMWVDVFDNPNSTSCFYFARAYG
jgi:hypothetical protein